MAMMITEECIGCAGCEAECPNLAIHVSGDIFEIDPDECTECVGFFDRPQCSISCPVECIVQVREPEYA